MVVETAFFIIGTFNPIHALILDGIKFGYEILYPPANPSKGMLEEPLIIPHIEQKR